MAWFRRTRVETTIGDGGSSISTETGSPDASVRTYRDYGAVVGYYDREFEEGLDLVTLEFNAPEKVTTEIPALPTPDTGLTDAESLEVERLDGILAAISARQQEASNRVDRLHGFGIREGNTHLLLAIGWAAIAGLGLSLGSIVDLVNERALGSERFVDAVSLFVNSFKRLRDLLARSFGTGFEQFEWVWHLAGLALVLFSIIAYLRAHRASALHSTIGTLMTGQSAGSETIWEAHDMTSRRAQYWGIAAVLAGLPGIGILMSPNQSAQTVSSFVLGYALAGAIAGAIVLYADHHAPSSTYVEGATLAKWLPRAFFASLAGVAVCFFLAQILLSVWPLLSAALITLSLITTLAIGLVCLAVGQSRKSIFVTERNFFHVQRDMAASKNRILERSAERHRREREALRNLALEAERTERDRASRKAARVAEYEEGYRIGQIARKLVGPDDRPPIGGPGISFPNPQPPSIN